MHLDPTRFRAILLPTILVASLFGATTVSAADGPTTSPASPAVAGSGVLAAEGDGHVRLAGSYILAGSLDGGTLRVHGVDRASIVRVTGWTSKTRLADGDRATRDCARSCMLSSAHERAHEPPAARGAGQGSR